MSFIAITPTRGDRPKLFEFCKKQIDRMTVKPNHHHMMTFPPESNRPDLTRRVRMAYEYARLMGHEYLFIIEDDDYYPPDYFERLKPFMEQGIDFIGSSKTVYYNVFQCTYQEFEHAGRSSLFCTGFKISALDGFKWPKDDYLFLDLELWTYVKRNTNLTTALITSNPIAIGIKHGIGMTGGKGHTIKLRKQDRHFKFLKANVDEEAFQFYTTLKA